MTNPPFRIILEPLTMAEAHQAVSYSELIKPEHTDANHDKEVLELVWKSGWRSWKKRIARYRAKLRNGIYPAHWDTLWLLIVLVNAIHFSTRARLPFDLNNILMRFTPE